jgi:hypothetical protein
MTLGGQPSPLNTREVCCRSPGKRADTKIVQHAIDKRFAHGKIVQHHIEASAVRTFADRFRRL